MTIDVSLGFDPIWSNFDLYGRPIGGGNLYSYDSLNPTVPKPIYQDPAGFIPYTNPILFDENGNAPGQFYFSLDTDNPDSLYNLIMTDSDNNTVWQVNNYFPSGGGGGGSVVEVLNLTNLVVNDIFWNNIGSTSLPISSTFLTLAPGLHDGFVTNLTATNGPASPDICFLKANLAATDQISFLPFAPGSLMDDTTPQQYFNYSCTSITSDIYKILQIPIALHVINLSNTPITFKIWAMSPIPGAQISVRIRTFYGDGSNGPHADDFTVTQTITLSSAWTPYTLSFTPDNVAGNTIGNCGNDGTFLQILFPVDSVANINLTKPQIYIGDFAPTVDFVTYDEIDSVVNTPRTGDIRTSANSFTPFGCLPMNDGTIGLPASNPSIPTNINIFPLFDLLWKSTSANPTFAQLYNSAGMAIGRGSSSISDYTANNKIALTYAAGRVLANCFGSSSSFGQPVGAASHVVGINEIPQHVHSEFNLGHFVDDVGEIGPGVYATGEYGGRANTTAGMVGFTAQTPISLYQPTTFMNFYIKI